MCWWFSIHGKIHGNRKNPNGWKWRCNCITCVLGVKWEKKRVYLSFDYYILHLSKKNFFKFDAIFMKVDIIYLLFLVVIGFVMIPKTRLLLYDPNTQILKIWCDVTLKNCFFLFMSFCTWVFLFSWIWYN